MHFLNRTIFVLGCIAAALVTIDYVILGNHGDFAMKSARIGEWRKAAIREACFPALRNIESDAQLPKLPQREHRIDAFDFYRASELTAALNCYVVVHPTAICEPNNRAYIVVYVGKYFAKMDEMMAIASKYGQDETNNVHEVWDSPRNRSIQSAITFDIKNGRLNRADFGWSVPGSIAPLLERHRNVADTCPNQLASK